MSEATIGENALDGLQGLRNAVNMGAREIGLSPSGFDYFQALLLPQIRKDTRQADGSYMFHGARIFPSLLPLTESK